MPETCKNWFGLVNSCVQYARQTHSPVLLHSVDFKTPRELWNPLRNTAFIRYRFVYSIKDLLNIWNERKAQRKFVRRTCKYFHNLWHCKCMCFYLSKTLNKWQEHEWYLSVQNSYPSSATRCSANLCGSMIKVINFCLCNHGTWHRNWRSVSNIGAFYQIALKKPNYKVLCWPNWDFKGKTHINYVSTSLWCGVLSQVSKKQDTWNTTPLRGTARIILANHYINIENKQK